MIYSYINTRGNWENSKLCLVSTQILFLPISTRLGITVYQHGKCLKFVKYNANLHADMIKCPVYIKFYDYLITYSQDCFIFIYNNCDIIIFLFVETPRKFISGKLSIRKPGSSSVLIICDLLNCNCDITFSTVFIPTPTLSNFLVEGNRSPRRKPTTFGRALADLHMSP